MLRQQYVFRVNRQVSVDGLELPGWVYERDGINVTVTPPNVFTVRVPGWARAYRFDGCSAGAGGGPDTGTIGGGGGCSGLGVLGLVRPCLPMEVLNVRVGQGGLARATAPDGRRTHTAVTGSIGSVCLGLGGWLGPSGTGGRQYGTSGPGAAGGAGGGWNAPARELVLGGAPAVAASNIPGQPGDVHAVGRWHGSASATSVATAVASGLPGGGGSRMPTEDLARCADLVTVMGGMGGMTAAFGEQRWMFGGAAVIIGNGGTPVPGGLGGLCLPFTNFATLPDGAWGLGSAENYSRPGWVGWWTDAGAGFGRGGIGDSVGLNDATPGGDGIVILTFMEGMP